MPKVKATNVGKGATVITLLSNPVIRRAVIKGASKAATSAADFVAAKREKSGAAAVPQTAGSQPPTEAVPGAGSKPAKPASIAEAAALESIVGSVASVAQPVAERLASSGTGRSVLEAVHTISARALGAAAPPRRAGASVANFVGSVLAGQPASKAPDRPEPASVKFTPIKPPAAAAAEPVETMQWPPPKSSNGF